MTCPLIHMASLRKIYKTISTIILTAENNELDGNVVTTKNARRKWIKRKLSSKLFEVIDHSFFFSDCFHPTPFKLAYVA
jgi:hypothetical protein